MYCPPGTVAVWAIWLFAKNRQRSY